MNEQLKPFDKVLVRQHSKQEWRADIYSHKNITTSNGEYHEIIPYEGNEHLLGTTDSPKPKRWRAKKNCEYYYINSRAEVVVDLEASTVVDNEQFNIGNYFRTRIEAEEMAVKIRALLAKAMLKGGE